MGRIFSEKDSRDAVSAPKKSYEPDLRAAADAPPANTARVESTNELFGVPGEQNARGPRSHKVAVLGVATLVIFVAVVLLPHGLLSSKGAELPTIAGFLGLASENIAGVVGAFMGSATSGPYETTVCHYIACAATGAALGACGAVFQGALKNALASPTTLGVMSGCNLGLTLYAVFFGLTAVGTVGSGTGFGSVSELGAQIDALNPLEYVWNIYGGALAAVAGGVLVAAFVLLINRLYGAGRTGNVMLLVAGQVIATIIGTFLNLFRYYLEYTGQTDLVEYMRSAQLSPFVLISSWGSLVWVLVPIALGLAAVLILRSRLELLSFGAEEAQTMGVNVGRLQSGMVMLCTAITGIVVAFCGTFGFVGFVVPHIARRVVGADFRHLVPASMFIGASFTLLVYFIVTQLNISAGVGLNYATSVIGCVAFLIIAFRGRRGSRAWAE